MIDSGKPQIVSSERLEFMYRVEQLQRRISYKQGYRLVVAVDKKDPQGRIYMQVECERPDIYTGAPGVGRGGKQYLSEHMTDSELVRIAFGLFMAYETHECREWFQVLDNEDIPVSVFGPHIALEALLVAGKDLDFR